VSRTSDLWQGRGSPADDGQPFHNRDKVSKITKQVSASVIQGRFVHSLANAFNVYLEGHTCWAMLFSAMSRAD
jgi:mannose/cellobiose epimerase-like protein (N-acyl-D-glucosamine 2-epimerase family)